MITDNLLELIQEVARNVTMQIKWRLVETVIHYKLVKKTKSNDLANIAIVKL